MNWTALSAAMKRRLWIIILFATFGAASGWALSRWEIAPVYQSNSLVMVIPYHSTGQNLVNGLIVGQRLVSTYATLATSPVLLQAAQKLLPNPLPLSQVAADVSVSAEANTNVIRIVADGPTAKRAANLSHAVSTVLVEKAQSATGSSVLRQVSPGIVNHVPISPKALVLEVGLGLGALIVTLLAVIGFEALNDSIVTADDLSRCTQLPILAEVPPLPAKRVRTSNRVTEAQGK